jgi:hypothetical protein
MNPIVTFLLGVFIVLAGAIAAVIYLRPHLRSILRDLCGTEERADFWTAFSNIILVLTPVIFALSSRPQGENGTATFFDVSSQLQRGLIGLVGAVIVLGIALSQFIPKSQKPPAVPAPPASPAQW